MLSFGTSVWHSRLALPFGTSAWHFRLAHLVNIPEVVGTSILELFGTGIPGAVDTFIWHYCLALALPFCDELLHCDEPLTAMHAFTAIHAFTAMNHFIVMNPLHCDEPPSLR